MSLRVSAKASLGPDCAKHNPLLDDPHDDCPRDAMKYLAALLLAAARIHGARETIQDAAVHARQLLHGENVLTLTSIFDPDVNPTLAGQPFAYGALSASLMLGLPSTMPTAPTMERRRCC